MTPSISISHLLFPFSFFIIAACGLIYLCIALLAIFGFTQNTNALPRQLYGRQYILRHHSRAHRHHVHQRAAGAEQMITIAAITPEAVQKSSKEFGPTLNQLQVAKDIANQSHKYVREMMENYVSNIALGSMGRSIHPTDNESSRTLDSAGCQYHQYGKVRAGSCHHV